MDLVRNKVKYFAQLVKFEHTIFALPFAYMGAILAQKGIPTGRVLFWITLAMIGARCTGMGLNRVIDRAIDSVNPRTANRHLPQGLLSMGEVIMFILLSFSVFLYCVYRLSPHHLVYVPLITVFLVGYSYTKRFTCLSHVVLGIAIGFAPLGGWIGVTKSFSLAPLLLGFVVVFWIAGFDIIYATQDLEFDITFGLYSMPANLGLKRALSIARVFHLLVIILLCTLYIILDLGFWYGLGVLFTSVLLYYEHTLVSFRDLRRVDMAFFNINGMVSILLLVFTFLDLYF